MPTVHNSGTDIQTVDSDCSKAILQEMQEVSKTQEGRDERVEKRSCDMELRGSHLKLDYYIGKQVLLLYILTCIYIYIYIYVYIHTVKYSFNIIDRYL